MILPTLLLLAASLLTPHPAHATTYETRLYFQRPCCIGAYVRCSNVPLHYCCGDLGTLYESVYTAVDGDQSPGVAVRTWAFAQQNRQVCTINLENGLCPSAVIAVISGVQYTLTQGFRAGDVEGEVVEREVVGRGNGMKCRSRMRGV